MVSVALTAEGRPVDGWFLRGVAAVSSLAFVVVVVPGWVLVGLFASDYFEAVVYEGICCRPAAPFWAAGSIAIATAGALVGLGGLVRALPVVVGRRSDWRFLVAVGFTLFLVGVLAAFSLAFTPDGATRQDLGI